ncbi:MAG: threonine/serine exporter family protein [Muribaculaceae bacterium]|nr:threonine/serine exporter family protein [Muribaculaceae bacterium]
MKNPTTSRLDFLGEYAAWLLGCGATCIRIEKNINRMARAFGVDAGVTIMPRHVEIYARSPQGDLSLPVVIRQAPHCGLNFTVNTRLSRLSWEVADGKIGYDEAVSRFAEITAAPPTPRNEVLLLASMANASFCRLFGGDLTAVLVVFVATLAGFKLKQMMMADRRDIRLVFLCCAFFSAAICAGAHIFEWGTTPEIALGTSVLYLIPGVPYINSVSDLLACHYLCAFSRFVDALVLTACLSVGLCAGMYLLGLRMF